jgi:undecaprenyl pyrophosphate phosphatase UppP
MQVGLGFAGMVVAALGGWLVYLVPTTTGMPDETSAEAAWLIASPALLGAAAMFLLSLGSVVNSSRREQLLAYAGITAVVILAWVVIVTLFFGLILAWLGSTSR